MPAPPRARKGAAAALLLLLALALPRTAAACASDEDCSLLGACAFLNASSPARSCICDEGFTGPSCAVLDLLPSEPGWGFVDPKSPSYGGSLVADGKNGYNLIVNTVDPRSNCSGADSLNGIVARAWAPRITGPYVLKEAPLAGLGLFHDAAQAVPDGLGGQLIFADAKAVSTADMLHACTSGAASASSGGHRSHGLMASQTHGAARSIEIVSLKPQPSNWTARPARVAVKMDPSAGPLCNRTNASPIVLSDDRILAAVSAGFCQRSDGSSTLCARKAGCGHIALFSISGLSGTGDLSASLQSTRLAMLDGTDEPFLWRSHRGLHILAHGSRHVCGDAQGCGLIASAANETAVWRGASGAAFDSNVVWSSGTTERLVARHRAKILFDSLGTPLWLVCAVRRASPGFPHTLLFPFNVHANAHLIDSGAPSANTPGNGALTEPASPNAARALVLALVVASLLFVLIRVRRRCAKEVGSYEELEKSALNS